MIKGINPRLAEAGKIKIGGLGEKRTKRGGDPKNPADQYRLPVKFPHFVITTTQRNPDGDLIADDLLMSALARDEDDRLTEIPIYVHSDEIDDVFPTAYACYTGRALHCSGDGEQATRWRITDGRRAGESKAVACPCDYRTDPDVRTGEQRRLPICRPHGTLHCSLAIPGLAVAGAVYRWRTTSIISIQRMIGSLQQILATCGGLRGLPLILRLTPVVVRGSTTVYCCHVELRAKDIQEAQQIALDAARMRQQIAAPQDSYHALIATPGSAAESEIEQAEVAQEFHSESLPHDPETGVVEESGTDTLAARLAERQP